MHPVAEALRDLDEAGVARLVDEEIAKGTPVLDVIAQLNEGIVAVGQLFSEGEYFISQLIFSAEILKNVMKQLDPLLAGSASADGVAAGGGRGRVVIGTVKGDIHDIGKDIVVTLLRGSGFEVIDLGVDVPADKFVESALSSGARAVGLSALLNFTYPEMKNVVEKFAQAGLRDRVSILIGGTPVNEQVREFTGADYYGEDAVEGVEICGRIYAEAASAGEAGAGGDRGGAGIGGSGALPTQEAAV